MKRSHSDYQSVSSNNMLKELTRDHEILTSKYSCLVQHNSTLIAKEKQFNEAISRRAEMHVTIDDLEIRFERKTKENDMMKIQYEADEITKFAYEKEIKELKEKDKERQKYNDFLLKNNQKHVLAMQSTEESNKMTRQTNIDLKDRLANMEKDEETLK